jgi:hypothetical protein
MPAKFQRRQSPAARGNWPGRSTELGRTYLGVMCRLEVTEVGKTAATRDGGGGARRWRRCSGGRRVGERRGSG